MTDDTVSEDRELGEKLLHAVERITASPAEILAVVDRYCADPEDTLEITTSGIVAHYSNRSALVGGATALPSLIPGVGSLATLVAAPLADMVFLLKYEVEMCLALSAAHGYDIHRDEERQMAFLLAALKTAQVSKSGSNYVNITGPALWQYTPRRVSKLLVTTLAIIGVAALSKHFIKAVPLLGVAVGASMNKILTTKVGRNAHEELRLRKKLSEETSLAR